jgi:hypothetical protein
MDLNRNGWLDDFERRVQVEFFVPVKASYRAIAVSWPPEAWFAEEKRDFVILSIIGGGPKSDISLLSTEDYDDIPVGQEIFAIGCPAGATPPHIYTGLRSTDSGALDRASLSAYFGNSGGGVFIRGANKLIGIVTQIRIDTAENRPLVVPQWTEFTSASMIREFANQSQVEFMLDEAR